MSRSLLALLAALLLAAQAGAASLTCPPGSAGSPLHCGPGGIAGWTPAFRSLQWDFRPVLGWEGVADIPFAAAVLVWAKLSCDGPRTQDILYDIARAPAWGGARTSLLAEPAVLPAGEAVHQVWLTTTETRPVVTDGEQLVVNAGTRSGVPDVGLACSLQILALLQ